LRNQSELSRLELAETELAGGQPAAAERLARQALRVLRQPGLVQEPWAQVVLARCLLAQDRRDEAAAAAHAARQHAGASPSVELRLAATVAAAAVAASGDDAGKAAAGCRELQAALHEAEAKRFWSLAMEARLALAQSRLLSDPAAGRATLRALGRDAAARGFGLVARQADALAALDSRRP
jgi:hypothetical protein